MVSPCIFVEKLFFFVLSIVINTMLITTLLGEKRAEGTISPTCSERAMWPRSYGETLSKERASPSQPSQLYEAFTWEKGWPLCPSQKLTTAFAHALIVSSWPGWASQSVSVEKLQPEEGEKGAPAWRVTFLAEPTFCFSFIFLFPEACSGRRVTLLPGGKHCLK